MGPVGHQWLLSRESVPSTICCSAMKSPVRGCGGFLGSRVARLTIPVQSEKVLDLCGRSAGSLPDHAALVEPVGAGVGDAARTSRDQDAPEVAVYAPR